MNALEIEDIVFTKFKHFFKKKTGQDILKYSEEWLKHKIKERLKALKINSYREYFEKFIIDNELDAEFDELFYLIINRESDFFRYPLQFEFLNNYVIPFMIVYLKESDINELNILSCGIAIGQEPYSIAMIMEENKEALHDIKVTIDAIDIVRKNLNIAREGEYTEDILRYWFRKSEEEFLFKDFINKYFEKIGKSVYKVRDSLKKYIKFFKMDIVNSLLVKMYDIIFIRNVIIYFDEETKKAVIKKVTEHLREGGYLFLGHGEYPVGMRDKYKTIFYKSTVIYQKK